MELQFLMIAMAGALSVDRALCGGKGA